jgi:hypothetical protein
LRGFLFERGFEMGKVDQTSFLLRQGRDYLIVRKFKMEDSKAMTTPMSTTTALDADEEGEHVDQKEY